VLATNYRQVASANIREGNENLQVGRIAQAVENFAAAGRAIAELRRIEPNNFDHVHAAAENFKALAMNEERIGNDEASIAAFRSSIEAYERLRRTDLPAHEQPPGQSRWIDSDERPIFQRIGAGYYQLGRTLSRKGMIVDAAEAFDKAAVEYQLVRPISVMHSLLADVYNYKAKAYELVGFATSAVESMQRAHLHLRAARNADEPSNRDPLGSASFRRTAQLAADNATILCEFGHVDLALSSAEITMRCYDAIFSVGADRTYHRDAAEVAAEVHRAAGRLDWAEKLQVRAQSIDVDGFKISSSFSEFVRETSLAIAATSWSQPEWRSKHQIPVAYWSPLLDELMSPDSDTVWVPIDRVRGTPQKIEHVLAVAEALASLAQYAISSNIDGAFVILTEAHCLFSFASQNWNESFPQDGARSREIWAELLRAGAAKYETGSAMEFDLRHLRESLGLMSVTALDSVTDPTSEPVSTRVPLTTSQAVSTSQAVPTSQPQSRRVIESPSPTTTSSPGTLFDVSIYHNDGNKGEEYDRVREVAFKIPIATEQQQVLNLACTICSVNVAIQVMSRDEHSKMVVRKRQKLRIIHVVLAVCGVLLLWLHNLGLSVVFVVLALVLYSIFRSNLRSFNWVTSTRSGPEGRHHAYAYEAKVVSSQG
jgi:tetratricopeptide (TPR) repeat protein